MSHQKFLCFFCVIGLIYCIEAVPIFFTSDSGNVRIRRAVDGAIIQVPVNEKNLIENGDTIFIEDISKAEGIIAESITFSVKSNSILTVISSGQNNTIELIKGQLLFKRDKTEDTSLYFEIKTKNCTFIPMGTIAAVRITKENYQGVAVLNGTVRMQNSNGAILDVPEKSYSSYLPDDAIFTPVRPLSAQAIATLESWAAINQAEEKIPEDANNQKISADSAAAKPDNTGDIKPALTDNNQNVNSSDSSTHKEDAKPAEPTKRDTPRLEQTKPASDSAKTQNQKNADADKTGKQNENKQKPQFDLNVGSVTVNNEQWTRLTFGIDLPIWRFGICFDIELFLDGKSNFSNKSWDFSSGKEAVKSIFRKIRYVRFNNSGDPVFIKAGGLNDVTFGYGFIVDKFTNMLNYPDEKLFGIQFELNDLSPIGVSLQATAPDLMEFGNKGGVVAARLGFRPLKKMDKPIISGITISSTFATDLNQYAPGRSWNFSLNGDSRDRDEDGITDSAYLYDNYNKFDYYPELVQYHKDSNNYDTKIEHKDHWVVDTVKPIRIAGADITVPVINTKVVKLDLYAQYGITLNDRDNGKIYKGWGIGAPGAGLKIGPFIANIEYRHIKDAFTPGYFGPYYFNERIIRYPDIIVKEQTLENMNLNGVFGQCGIDIMKFLTIHGTYQFLISSEKFEDKKIKDQRFEATAEVGEMIVKKIPKINKIEAFFHQTEIDNKEKYHKFFHRTPTTYWGYRLGFEIGGGTYIIWETRYGWLFNKDRTGLVDNKRVGIAAGVKF